MDFPSTACRSADGTYVRFHNHGITPLVRYHHLIQARWRHMAENTSKLWRSLYFFCLKSAVIMSKYVNSLRVKLRNFTLALFYLWCEWGDGGAAVMVLLSKKTPARLGYGVAAPLWLEPYHIYISWYTIKYMAMWLSGSCTDFLHSYFTRMTYGGTLYHPGDILHWP